MISMHLSWKTVEIPGISALKSKQHRSPPHDPISVTFEGMIVSFLEIKFQCNFAIKTALYLVALP